VTRYVEEEWFPNHVIELTTRENYRYILNKYVLPELGGMRMVGRHPRVDHHVADEVRGEPADDPAMQGGRGRRSSPRP
jgi:hypothetical protein